MLFLLQKLTMTFVAIGSILTWILILYSCLGLYK